MKALLALAAIAATGLPQTDSLTWQSRPQSPLAVHRTAGCCAGTYFYLMGGYNSTTTTDSVFRYDNNLGTWTRRARMSFPTSNHCAVFFEPENRIYVFGGELGIAYEYVQVYDVSRDSWFYRYMPYADYGMSAAVLADSIFVAFGAEHPGLFYRYHPRTNDWAPRASFPDSAFNGAMCALDGRLYCAGGWDSLRVFRRYDPAANAWAVLPDLPQGRHGLGLIALAGLIYTLGGGQRWNTGVDCRTVYAFDPDSGNWRYDSRMNNLHIAGAYGTYTVAPNAYLFAVSGYNARACEVGHRLISGIRSDPAAWTPPRTLEAAPNPFCRQTAISLQPAADGARELRIYSASGRLVRSFFFPCSLLPAPCSLTWSGSDASGSSLPAGVYVLACGSERLAVRKLDAGNPE